MWDVHHGWSVDSSVRNIPARITQAARYSYQLLDGLHFSMSHNTLSSLIHFTHADQLQSSLANYDTHSFTSYIHSLTPVLPTDMDLAR